MSSLFADLRLVPCVAVLNLAPVPPPFAPSGHDLYRALQLRSAATGSRLFGWRQHGKRVALQVAQALAYLHRKNVMHCDIKSPK